MSLPKTHPPSPASPTDIRSIINTFVYNRDLFNTIVKIDEIWQPEWKNLKIIKANTEYILLANHHVVFHSPSFDRALIELHRHLDDPIA